MKKMIIIAVCLVTAAIVYGFVDYLKTDKAALNRMYNEEEQTTKTAAPAKQADAPARQSSITAKPAVTIAVDTAERVKKPAIKQYSKKFDLELYSRAAPRRKFKKPDSVMLEEVPVEEKGIEVKKD